MISSSLAAALIAALAQTPAQPAPPKPPAIATPAPVPNPFRHMLTNLGKDARSLGTIEPIIVLAVGGAGAIASHNNDIPVRDWALAKSPESEVATIGNVLGDGFLQSGAAIAVWAFGREKKNVRLEATGSDLIRAQLLNGVLTQVLKRVVDRDRPDGGGHAFPSGHASAAFATAAVIQRNYGAVKSAPFYALGGFVGWSRVRTGHHWLSDVVFGGALGISSGLAATHGRAGKWSVIPVKTSGGAALYVIRR
jgi:membrane-associated phospholipid phosphatase